MPTKTLYLVTVENYQGMFDNKNKLLSYWHNNDASWREEYFDDLMHQLGFTVKYSDDVELKNKLNKVTKD